MHSQSNRPDPTICSDKNTLTSKGSTATKIDDHEDTHSRCTKHVNSSKHFRDNVRIATLKAEVKLLESERDTLNEQIGDLKTDIENLEEEIVSLENDIQRKNVQHQQVINEYEKIIAERNQDYQGLEERPDGPKPPTNNWPISTVRSLVRSVYEWVKLALLSKY